MPEPRRHAVAPLLEAVLLISSLLRGELELARAEVAENLRAALIGAVLVIVSVLLALVGLHLLAAGAVTLAIHAGVSPHWAPVIVGMGALLLAALAAWRGLRALRPSRLVPNRAAARLRRDAEHFKEMIKDDAQT